MKGKPLVAVVSAGLSKFGKREESTGRDLFAEAALEAFERCPNLGPKKDIKGLVVGMMSENFEHQGHSAPMLSDWAGLLPAPAVRTEIACASAGAALRYGVACVLSGFYDIVMVGGFEKMTKRTTAEVTEYLAMAADFPFEQWNGVTFPGLFALMATAHMHEYGTTEEQLGLIAVKNHHNGALNPKAHLQKEVSLEKVLASRMIAKPLKLYDCSLISDGASCAILTRPEIAKKYTDDPLYIIGSGHGSDTLGLYGRESLTSIKATRNAAEEAYGMAGIKPDDVDVAEVHDCFTIAELIAYEDLGFCKPGEGGKFIEDSVPTLDGDLPVNTSGGLKSKGHPVGATGIAQLYEVFLQLTGQAEKRQVEGCEVCLTQNLGGSGASCLVHVYRRG
ncbi:MAG: thiolase domain-containing protein [Candidatus Bathyarchaeota archaeon]|nr:thiolase domain-containing protein [Candidatus Bathyarchaeota archaeon]